MNFNRIFLAVLFTLSLCMGGCTAVKKHENAPEKQNLAPGSSAVPEQFEIERSSIYGSGPNQYYYFIRAQLAAETGRMEEAAGFLEKAIEQAPHEPLLKKELALTYLELDRKEDALSMAEAVLKQTPGELEALIVAASIRQSTGKYEAAKRAYEKVVEKDPDRKNIYLALARLYLHDDENKKAADLLKQFVKRFPENYSGFYYLAKAYHGMDMFDKAVEAYGKTLELSPGLVEPRIGLIETYKSQGRQDKVVLQYEKLLERHPDNVSAAIELGLLYEKRKENFKAEDLWSKLASRLTSNPDIIKSFARRLLAQQRYSDATVVLSKMLGQSPQSPELHYLAGAARYMMKHFDEALKHFNVIGPGDDLYSDAMIHRAIILNRQKKTGQAIKVLEGAMEKLGGKKKVGLIPYLSAFYQERGHYKQAEDVLEKGLLMEPENVDLHYELGVLYDRMGNTKAAIDKMHYVIRMDPENADALNYLGYTYADKGVKLDRAESLIRRALEIEPDNGYILDSMGWVFYKKGEYEKALTYIEKALSKVSDDPVILEHMGDVLLKLSKRARALDYYRQARKNTAEDEDREELAKKIESVQSKKGFKP